MMTTRQALYVHVLMVVVAVGLLFIAGTGKVRAAHKQCHAERDTCRANLSTCNANLSQARGDLSTCNTNLSQAQGELTTCNTDLSQAQGELSTCNADLGTCNTSLSQSQGNLATCNTNLTQSEANLATCEADLADCEANASAFPATGQTTSFLGGDDGDLEAGATLSYTDNGDGTITDNNTGLQWEKKSDDGTINDKDTTYTWEDALVHAAVLNTVNFAGFNDWRLPNIKELQSIVNYGTVNPAVSSEFNREL